MELKHENKVEEKPKERDKDKTGFLVSQELYLKSGVHIGTKIKTGEMRKFIYRRRGDKLYVLNLREIDNRLRLAAKELARFEPEDILVTASRTYATSAAAMFCKIIGARLYPGRFIPGVLTNPSRPDFVEPKILLISDPRGESRAIDEAGKMGIPVIALCDTDNSTRNVDWIVPCNNKGRRSLALIYYILAREYLLARGIISSHKEFRYRPRDFEDGEVPEELIEAFRKHKGQPASEFLDTFIKHVEPEQEEPSEQVQTSGQPEPVPTSESQNTDAGSPNTETQPEK